MPGSVPYLGYPGALQALARPAFGYAPVDEVRAGDHELLSGARVRDRIGVRRRFTLNWQAMVDADWALVRALARIPGPFRYLDPLEPNMLTANQSTGTDELRTTEGVTARFQGTVSSSTAQQRSWQRSIAWATGTALAATNRGIYCYNSPSTVDSTWTAVRPSTAYTCSGYLRASAAVSMYAGFDYHDAAGVYISTSAFGSSTALSTSNFNTRVTQTATTPATAAYAIPFWLNSTTTGAAITVYADELQMEQAGAATAFDLGAGTPWVSVESLNHSVVMVYASTSTARHEVELVLVEVG
jgi:hypothetical protein